MTIPPISVEKSAETLVYIFGDLKPAHACERMAEYEGAAYKHGCRFWIAVANETEKLLEREAAAERLNSRPQGGKRNIFNPSPFSPLR